MVYSYSLLADGEAEKKILDALTGGIGSVESG